MKLHKLETEQDRRAKIIEYIQNNQGCNVQALVKGVNENISRVTVYKTLESLKQTGAITVHKDKPNSRDHKLFVAADNLLVSVSQELTQFENAYISFLQKAKEKITTKSRSSYLDEIAQRLGKKQGTRWSESDIDMFSKFQYEGLQKLSKKIEQTYSIIRKLKKTARRQQDKIDLAPEASTVQVPITFIKRVSEITKQIRSLKSNLEDAPHFEILFLPIAALWVFDSMVHSYLYRSTFIWPIKIQDKEYLMELHGLIHTKIITIQTHLSDFFSFFRVGRNEERSIGYITLLSHTRPLLPEVIFTSPIYAALDMKKEIELVAKCLCKISDELGKYNYNTLEFLQCRELLENLESYDELLQLKVPSVTDEG